MPIDWQQTHDGRVIEITVSGKLTRDDYTHFADTMDELIQSHDRMRILIVMPDLEGWTGGAFWEDLKFGIKHYRDVERVAIVGEGRWQKIMAFLSKPFTAAEVRYFIPAQIDAARQWLAEGL